MDGTVITVFKCLIIYNIYINVSTYCDFNESSLNTPLDDARYADGSNYRLNCTTLQNERKVSAGFDRERKSLEVRDRVVPLNLRWLIQD